MTEWSSNPISHTQLVGGQPKEEKSRVESLCHRPPARWILIRKSERGAITSNEWKRGEIAEGKWGANTVAWRLANTAMVNKINLSVIFPKGTVINYKRTGWLFPCPSPPLAVHLKSRFDHIRRSRMWQDGQTDRAGRIKEQQHWEGVLK